MTEKRKSWTRNVFRTHRRNFQKLFFLKETKKTFFSKESVFVSIRGFEIVGEVETRIGLIVAGFRSKLFRSEPKKSRIFRVNPISSIHLSSSVREEVKIDLVVCVVDVIRNVMINLSVLLVCWVIKKTIHLKSPNFLIGRIIFLTLPRRGSSVGRASLGHSATLLAWVRLTGETFHLFLSNAAA